MGERKRERCTRCRRELAGHLDYCEGFNSDELCMATRHYSCDDYVLRHFTYNPATHQVVRKGAVVLERVVAERFMAEAHNIAVFEERVENEGELDRADVALEDLEEALRSALASAQGNEEGNDGDPDTGEGG